jgi:TonB family protein
MKYAFLFLFLGSINLFAQSSLTPASDSTENDHEQLFTVVDNMPTPQGGMETLYKWISRNVKYPASARRMGEQGTTFISFVVRTDGSITDVTTVKGVSPAIDAEGERVIALMPPWKPGSQDGEPVNVRYVLPIKFQLEDSTPNADVVYVIVEKMPEFPGGSKGMQRYVKRTIQYPADVKKGSINQSVFVEFIVERDGSRSEVKVLKGVSPSLDAEAIRVVNTFPGWKPGKQSGALVRVKVVVPITFK